MLQRHIRWADQTWLVLLFAPGSAATAPLMEKTRVLLQELERRLEVIHPTEPKLLRQVPSEILNTSGEDTCVWIDGVRLGRLPSGEGQDSWLDAWEWSLQRMNERREQILHCARGGLILAMPGVLKDRVAELAPDLWTIRSLTLDLTYVRSGQVQLASRVLDLPFVEDDDLAVDLDLALADEAQLLGKLQAVADNPLRGDPSNESDQLKYLEKALGETRLQIAAALRSEGDLAAAKSKLLEILEPTPKDRALWAQAMGQYGRVLELGGMRHEALRALELGTAWLREQEQSNPGIYRGELAARLRRSGTLLLELDRPAEAVAVLQEAVTLLERETSAHASTRGLADSLWSLGVAFSRLEQMEPALNALERARALLETRVEQSGRHQGLLGLLLAEQGTVLEALEQPEQAMAVLARARAIFEEMAREQPGVHLPMYAHVMASQAGLLAGLGSFEEAIPAHQDALWVFRDLAREQPGKYQDTLAFSLGRFGLTLFDAGRTREAREACDEAVALFRTLARSDDQELLPLANLLQLYAHRLEKNELTRKALGTQTQAVEVLRKLSEIQPETYLIELATALSHHASMLRRAGKKRKAVARQGEAIEVLRGLYRAQPEQFGPGLARALGFLSALLLLRDRPVEAMEAAVEQEELERRHGREP